MDVTNRGICLSETGVTYHVTSVFLWSVVEHRTHNRGIQVSRFKFDQIDLAMTSLLANEPSATESECARDQSQNAAVTR